MLLSRRAVGLLAAEYPVLVLKHHIDRRSARRSAAGRRALYDADRKVVQLLSLIIMLTNIDKRGNQAHLDMLISFTKDFAKATGLPVGLYDSHVAELRQWSAANGGVFALIN